MLITKRPRVRRRKADWFSSKPRVHLDERIDRIEAEKLVTDPAAVARHAFLPLISFQKRERRYRRTPGSKKPKATTKVRELAYPANRDGHIYAYYSEVLGERYEEEIALRGLQGVVIGYPKNACNVRLARDAFLEIANRGDCVALALDIKGFFDNIDHSVLKEVWQHLLGVSTLPDDHYKVFRALTAYAKMDRADLLSRLGLKPNTKDKDLPQPLCAMAEYRKHRTSSSCAKKLVEANQKTYGIPQGTPLSAMAANISMLHFDAEVNATVTACGGSYRRYSDDILIICSADHVSQLESTVQASLLTTTRTLKLNKSKREEVHFALPGPSLVMIATGIAPKPLQYLGFTFDGQNVRIRGGTLARFHRRLATSAKAAKMKAWLAKSGKIVGRDVLHKREVLAKYSHLGKDSFPSRYTKRAQKIMAPLGSEPIRRQLAGHIDTLNKKLQD